MAFFFLFLINSAMIFLLSVPSHFFEGMKENIAKIDFSYKLLFFFSFHFFLFFMISNSLKQKKTFSYIRCWLFVVISDKKKKRMIHKFNFLLTNFLYLRSDFIVFVFFFFFRDFLPRGSGIVTRRPLILQLINATTGNYLINYLWQEKKIGFEMLLYIKSFISFMKMVR